MPPDMVFLIVPNAHIFWEPPLLAIKSNHSLLLLEPMLYCIRYQSDRRNFGWIVGTRYNTDMSNLGSVTCHLSLDRPTLIPITVGFGSDLR
jgi:hypothetical protein